MLARSEIERRLALAIATVCDYICLDRDLARYGACREKCIEWLRDLVEEAREAKIFRKSG